MRFLIRPKDFQGSSVETYALFRAYLSELSDSVGFGFVLLIVFELFYNPRDNIYRVNDI